jgi:hypothetical protein
MKSFIQTLAAFLAVCLLVSIYACEKEEIGWDRKKNLTTPLVVTLDVEDIQVSSAVCGGLVKNDGHAYVDERGIAISRTTEPDINDTLFKAGVEVGQFKIGLTPLQSGTTYFYRAYAKNRIGIGYGVVKSFTTDVAPAAPSVSTDSVNSISYNSINAYGFVASPGTDSVTSRGFCWSTSPNPTISAQRKNVGSGTGAFSTTLATLSTNTTYYLRAFAINSVGVAYGTELVFTTLPPALPTVITTTFTQIGATSASGAGSVTNAGSSGVTTRGLCWSTNPGPTISNSNCTSGTGTGGFTCTLTGLAPNTLYYVRAFAVSSVGTAYGNEVTFTTLAPVLPTITTNAVTGITTNGATCGGTIANAGSSNVTVRGICWSTTPNPTTSGNSTNSGSGTGSFSIVLSVLNPSTTYYIRAFATSSAGTSYGNEVSFTTLAGVVPSVSTVGTSSITGTTAVGSGNVTNQGSSAVTQRGICWGISSLPTTANFTCQNGSGTGSYSCTMTGLQQNTFYYVRAYAINATGTAYGPQLSFQTATLPTVTTGSVSSINTTSAVCSGAVNSPGTNSVTQRGICWSTTSNPTIANSTCTSGTGTGSFSCTATGLTSGTLYYARAFATSASGTAYGAQVTFSTLASTLPFVTTVSVNTTSTTTATASGSVTASASAVTSRGICWSTSPNPTTANSTCVNGSGLGTYACSLTGLSAGTTYYVRAFAINSSGTSYGSTLTLLTASLPSVTTGTANSVTTSGAICSGTVNTQGSFSVNQRGICYSTSQNPTILNSTCVSGSGSGAYSCTLIGLLPGTTYYFRAYATSTAGTGYGTQASFTTVSGTLPTVTTTSASATGPTTISANGNVNSSGSTTVTQRGFCWATTSNPTTSNNVTTSGSGIGAFSANITGLNQNTTYYLRAFATNSAGTAYGSQLTISTPGSTPSPVFPLTGAVLTSLNYQTLTYSWTSIIGATQYRIHISKDPTFSAAQITITSCPGPATGPGTTIVNTATVTNNSFCINHGSASQNGTWYWRVQAFTASGWGAWSPTQSYSWTW